MSNYKPHVVIDEQKNIILPEELKNHMVQYDHNVKTITFDCPRYSDGRDLSTMRIYVNYFRMSGEKDADRCENITVDSVDNNLIHFEWVPKRSATLEQGVLAFLICAEKEDAGGNQENAWHTKLCKDLKIAEGMDCLNAVIEKYPTIITYLLTRMEDVESIATPEAMQAYVNQYLLENPPSGMTDEERTLLEENIALTEQIQTDLATTTQSKADAIICEAEGTTIVATDSSDAGFEGLSLYGKGKQGSTTGAQLFDASTAVSGLISTENGKATNSTWWMRSDFISVSPLNDYCISQSTTVYFQYNVVFYDESKKYISGIAEGKANTTKWTFQTPENAKYMRMSYSVIVDNTAVDRGNIMLNAGTEPLPYEPYTGNKPSPNPKYPQEVVSVGNGGSVEGKVCGKNLLKVIASTQTKDGVTFTVNSDGSITLNGTATKTMNLTLCYATDFSKKVLTMSLKKPSHISGNAVSLLVTDNKNSKNSHTTTGSNLTFNGYNGLVTYLTIASSASFTNDTIYPMIRLASIEDDTYEPYKETTVTLQTPNGLPGIPIGTTIPGVIKNSPIHMSGVYWDNEEGQYYIADTVDNENGVKVQRVGKAVFDGSATPSVNIISNNRLFYYNLPRHAMPNVFIGRCTHFIADGRHSSDLHARIDHHVCYFKYDAMENTDEFVAFLRENPITVQYILATPIETPLSDEEIAAYKALHTNKPTTIITNSENVYMKCSYVADTKIHIKQNYVPLSEYTALEERVAAIEELVIS